MKEYWAKDLEGKHLRIVAEGTVFLTTVSIAETGEVIENVAELSIWGKPRKSAGLRATFILYHPKGQPEEEEFSTTDFDYNIVTFGGFTKVLDEPESRRELLAVC